MADKDEEARPIRLRADFDGGAAAADIPPGKIEPGKIEMIITYLEMRTRPTRAAVTTPALKLALLRAERPTVAFYRFLYDMVGGPWLWYERRLLDDRALAAIIEDPRVAVYVLYVAGVPAGYAELDRRVEGEVELAYFGLMPEFTGRGLGPYLLDRAVELAWRGDPTRVWVHTCNLDHPAALGVYQRAGFSVYRHSRELIDDPRRVGAGGPA